METRTMQPRSAITRETEKKERKDKTLFLFRKEIPSHTLSLYAIFMPVLATI